MGPIVLADAKDRESRGWSMPFVFASWSSILVRTLIVRLCWACVGPCWGYVGPVLGLLWAFGRPADVDIVVFLGTAPYACGYVEPLLGLCWAMLAHVGAMLGVCWPMLGHVGPCWGYVGHMLAIVGPCWPHVGPMLGLWSAGRRGHSGISRHRALCMWLWSAGRRGHSVISRHRAYACGYVEPLLGLCWAMLAHVGAMLGLCWAHVGPMLGLWSAGRRGHSGISRHRALCMWLC